MTPNGIPIAKSGQHNLMPAAMPTSPEYSVLLVDDAKDCLETLSAALCADGFTVRTAESGEQALAQLADGAPAALVSDLEMPDMDGYELARRVRTLYPDDEVRLIALSGTLPPGKSQLTNCFGFDYLVGKPVRLDELESLLQS